MDMYCKFCGEPWDHDCLHDMGDFDTNISSLTYKQAGDRFRKLGCGAFKNGNNKCQHSMVDPDNAAISEANMIMSDYPEEWIL
tara:strand:+ start:568 stop:816 length:249 start_codon:yes stop_codon:yes gene_type:complete